MGDSGLADHQTVTCIPTHTDSSRAVRTDCLRRGEGEEVGLLPQKPGPEQPHLTKPGLGKPEVSTLPSFADEIWNKGIAKNFCFALF